ncbi:CDP-glycerol:glycerophosphate glycerophosphotransferase, partial [Streptococcus sp. KR]
DYSDFVYDYSNYPNISDLYLVSDLLITDYSSVFFDYAYLKRPILFYPYDYHLYKEELRGFYLNYEKDLPGKIA